MGECLVGVGHAVDVLALRVGAALAIEGGRSSAASLSAVGRPFFSRTAPKIQRIASDCCRVLLTCIGTWYDAPPTRFERTSMFGLTFSTAWVKTSMGSVSLIFLPMISKAP